MSQLHDWLERMPPGTDVSVVRLPSGIKLRVYARGTGPTLLFLHGFPERAVSWHNQFAALDGFRCIAPDLRGFGGSSQPQGRWHYRTGALVQDVVQLIDHLGGPVHLVAHDWGGALAWEVASHHPERVRSLSALNAPPLSIMLRSFTRLSQLRRSWYMFFFQLPILPERWLSSDPETMVRRSIFQAAGRREVFDDESLAPYIEQVGAGFKGIDWYRGAMLSLPTRPQPIQCPVQILWGLADPALEAEVFADPERYAGWVDELEITRLPGIGHWIQQEAPDAVSEAIATFISRG